MKRTGYFFLLLVLAICGIAASKKTLSKNTGTEIKVQSFEKFHESPLMTIRAKGWLLEFLKRQQAGLTGHPDVLSYPFNTVLWAGNISRENESHGDNWWRYEQTAYYSDGLLRLGYLLSDQKMIDKGKQGINHTLSHPQKNGRLGPELFASQWPIAVYFRALQAEYLATGNEEIVEALHKHYLSYQPEEIGMKKRAIVNLEGMLWTYQKTGDKKLLELAEKAFALGGFELNLAVDLSAEKPVFHGVTYMEMSKIPALLHQYTGKNIYLEAALNAMRKLDQFHMLPDGVPSSNEFLAGKNPIDSHETCDISDYTWTAGYLLMVTGDAKWADKIEKAIFNAGPGSVSKDFKNLQYFSSVNQFIATGNSNHNKHANGSGWMAYWPCHETECCAGNVHRFMPNYVARMWMFDQQQGLVAAMYGPSTQKINLPNGNSCTVNEETNYPFSDQIKFVFNPDHAVTMPFTFRIPVWCTKPSLSINGKKQTTKLTTGTYITIKRLFKKGDVIELQLPATVKLMGNANDGLHIERGSLLFAFAIPEQVTIDNKTYEALGGKKSLDPNFPALDIKPKGAWNYALAVNQQDFKQKIKFLTTNTTGYPFDPETVGMQIQVPVKEVKGWVLRENRYTPNLPVAGSFSCEQEVKAINLVPYGSTRLRLSVFPAAK
jgi:hypothetical protein